MDDIIEFLNARLDEDGARNKQDPTGYHRMDSYHTVVCGYNQVEFSDDCICGYAARVLREVEAKRAVLGLHVLGERVCDRCSDDWHTQLRPCRTVKILATVYRDHPNYREEWAL